MRALQRRTRSPYRIASVDGADARPLEEKPAIDARSPREPRVRDSELMRGNSPSFVCAPATIHEKPQETRAIGAAACHSGVNELQRALAP